MQIPFAGELASILTSIAFSIAPAFFTLSGQLVGSVIVNRSRLVAAVFLLSITHFILLGSFVPINAGGERWFWFVISGVVGLTLGDAALFQAFLMLGTRMTMLIFATSPVISALLGWLFLDETLASPQLWGMAIALGGVAWVSSQSNAAQQKLSGRQYALGILFAVIASGGQAFGLLTAKIGLANNFPSISGVLMRMSAAALAIWIWTFLAGQAGPTIQKLKLHPTAVKYILIASFVGPFLGVWLSLVSVQLTENLGVASTLQSLPPIFLIPISYYVFKEKLTWRAVLGTLVTLGGVAILFLV